MNDELEKALRRAIPPVERTELRRDLWPAIRARIEQSEPGFGRLDWLMSGAAVVWMIMFPGAITTVLLHL